MKRVGSFLALICFCFCIMTVAIVPANAVSEKSRTRKNIAIVFDNSGSMYLNNNTAWCRATYAMEVFASMLNDEDHLSIYPMHLIKIDEQSFSMDQPFTISGPAQASKIRNIYTPKATGTPIEAIDCAYNGLLGEDGEKWLIVLTDGDSFYQNDMNLGKEKSKLALDNRFADYVKDMNILYLGIGQEAVMPDSTDGSSYKISTEKATDSADVLSKLTEMCNMIFGRDSIPASHFQNNQMKIDVSMNKMIIFVQGENISNLSITNASGQSIGTLKSSVSTRYGEKGADGLPFAIDEKLQGIIVTYTDCAIGDYTISYSGTASSVEVYYEPDVEMSFTFTDEEGREVKPDQLYEGDYNIAFGMMDGRTGEFTNSDLLGETEYSGHYTINGESFPIESKEKSGSVRVSLKEGDSFNADMTVRYLSGYTIHKDGGEFGWPLSVSSRPAGNLELSISGGDGEYELTTLESGRPYKAEIYYQGEKLTGEELEKAEIKWDQGKSGALLETIFHDDYYEIALSHKDPEHPENTPTGEFSFPMTVTYKAPGSEEAQSFPQPFTYSINDSQMSIQVRLIATQGYYVIRNLEKGAPVRAEITMNGGRLSAEDFEKIDFTASCPGIELTQEPLAEESAILLYLEPSENLKSGDYTISCAVNAEDEIGRRITGEDKTVIELSIVPLWLKWAIGLLILLLLILLIVTILHIKALPKNLHIRKRESNMTFDGEDDTQNTPFEGVIDKKALGVFAKRNGSKIGIMMNVKPAKGSYLKTPQAKRVAEVDSNSIKVIGGAMIHEASVGSVRYVYDEEKRKLVRTPPSEKPFNVKQSTPVMFSGDLRSNGELKNFSVRTKLNFKKK